MGNRVKDAMGRFTKKDAEASPADPEGEKERPSFAKVREEAKNKPAEEAQIETPPDPADNPTAIPVPVHVDKEPTLHLVGHTWGPKGDEAVTVRKLTPKYDLSLADSAWALCECGPRKDDGTTDHNIVGKAIIKQTWRGHLGSIPARLVEQVRERQTHAPVNNPEPVEIVNGVTYTTLVESLARVYPDADDHMPTVAITYRRVG